MAAILMGSCALKNSANYTPDLVAGRPYIYSTDTALIDTLHVSYDSKTSRYLLDTLVVGDTMLISFGMQTYANFLDSFTVHYDKTAMECFYDKEGMKNILPCLTDSAQSGTSLHFKKGYNGLSIGLFSKMLKSGKHSVTVCVYSDAVFDKEMGMNTRSFSYDVLVVDSVK